MSASTSTAVNTAAMAQQKYTEEREKRLRPDGLSQYHHLSTLDKLKEYREDPWIDAHGSTSHAKAPALTDGSRCKYLIIGAGFGGLLFAIRLIQTGIPLDEIRMVDSAGGYGGTWYWNRYPGSMCDTESYIYMPLLEEMDYVPKHKYSYGPELRAYAESLGDKYGLRDKTLFQTETKALVWDEKECEWTVDLKRTQQAGGDTLTIGSQFVILVPGLLSTPQLPGIPGLKSFQGHSFHTSRWDYSYTGGSPADPSLLNLKDKRVGIVGTGASAVQVVPHLAKWSKELYVFQRTPPPISKRDNRPTDMTRWKEEVATKKGWQRGRNENLSAILSRVSPAPETDLVNDGLSALPTYHAVLGGPKLVSPDTLQEHIASLLALGLPHQESVRNHVQSTVKDPATAEKLKPWYPGFCRHPCLHDDYLPSFNLPNVTLVDTDGKGVDSITENGLVVDGKEYPVDLLIFSTGFKAPAIFSPATIAGMSITDRNNQSLDQKWADGLSTLHGVITNGFPNLFWPGPNQAAFTANWTYTLDLLSEHVAFILSEAARRATMSRYTVEPTSEAEQDWAMQIIQHAPSLAAMVGCTPGYINGEGMLAGVTDPAVLMKAARLAIWGHGIGDYIKVIEGWRNQGDLAGLEVVTVP